MIHYINVAVALERPPGEHQWRRYAIYGGTHADAELTALQMASCTSVMPVRVERKEPPDSGPFSGPCCCWASCSHVSPVAPHGALGCRCWPGVLDGGDPDTEVERWLVDEYCPHHGLDITPPEDVPWADCVSADPEVWLNCACTTDEGCKGPRPECPCPAGDADCAGCYDTATPTGGPPATASPTLPGAADADAETCDVCGWDGLADHSVCFPPKPVIEQRQEILSPGRVECQFCGTAWEYWDDDIPAYRKLVVHWTSGECEEYRCNSASQPGRRIRGFLTRVLKRLKGS